MTVGELLERLDGVDENLEVRLMTQPTYPLESAVDGAVLASEITYECEDECECETAEECQCGTHEESYKPVRDDGSFSQEGGPVDVFYLCEGRQLGYGTEAAWNSL